MSTPYRLRAIACAAALTVAGFAPFAAAQTSTPLVTIDVRDHDTGGKDVVVNKVGDSFTLDLVVTVTGADSDPTNDGIVGLLTGFRTSTGGVLGDLFVLPSVAPFSTVLDTGVNQDVDGDGDLDLGPVSQTSSNPYCYFRSGGVVINTSPTGILMGQIRFTATSLSETPTVLNCFPSLYYTVLSTGGVIASFDGGAKTRYQADGPYVHIDPGVTIRAGTIIDPGPVTYLSGTISTHLTVDGNVQPAPGTTLTVANGISVNAGGTFDTGLSGPHQVIVNDTVSGNSGGSLTTGTMIVGSTSAGAFDNADGYSAIGQLTVGSGANGSVSVGGGNLSAQTAVIGATTPGSLSQSGGATSINALTMSGGAVASTITSTGGDLSVSGTAYLGKNGQATIDHSAGTIEFGDVTYLGSTSAGSGIYNLSGTGTLNANWLNVGGAGYGEVNQSGGTANLNRMEVGRNAPAGSTLQGKYSLSDGVLNAATVLISFPGAGQIVQTGGTANITGNMYLRASTLATQYDLQAGQLNSSYTYIGWKNGILDTDQPGRFTQSGGMHSADHLAIGKLGIYQLTGGTLRINKDLRLQGTLDLANSSATVVAGQNSFVDFSTGTLANTSNATVTGETNSLINFAAGFDPFTQIGNFSSDGLVHIDGEPLVIPQGRSVHGNGNIDGQVTNHGLISPGNSPGAISVTGDYDQANDAALQIELGGATTDLYDALSVTGVASLAGTLNVSLLGDFVPTPDEQFQILTAGSRTGHFDTVNFTGGSFDVAYTPTGVTLSNFTAVPEPTGLALLSSALLIFRRRRCR